MPKITWKQFLKKEVKLSPNAEHNMRFEIRHRAQQAMEDLTFILDSLKEPGVSKHRERDYALIFQDEDLYFRMIQACHNAYDESYKSKLKLYVPEHMSIIWKICLEAGIKVPPMEKMFSNRNIKDRILSQLEKKKTEDCQSYLERAQQRILLWKDQEKAAKPCSLILSLNKLAYDPKDWGLTIGDLFEGKDCVGWKKCKQIKDVLRNVVKP